MTSILRRKPFLRAIAVMALAVGLFAAAPSTAGAAEACSAIPGDYASTMTLKANPTTTTPGGTVVITGSGYPTNCVLTVYVDGGSIGQVTTDNDGNFTIDWHVPSTAKEGPHVISTNVSNIVKKANVKVVITGGNGGGGGNGAGTGILPKTGSDIMPFLGGGVALLVLGGLLVLGTRKRSTRKI